MTTTRTFIYRSVALLIAAAMVVVLVFVFIQYLLVAPYQETERNSSDRPPQDETVRTKINALNGL